MQRPQRILITGASGCVGQYIAELLYRQTDAELLLLLRDPAKLTAVPQDDPRVTLVVTDLRELGKPGQEAAAAAIGSASRILHTATAWGDPERAQRVNVEAVKILLNLTDPERLEQLIYFSTASVLDRRLHLLPEASRYGTEYIQTKALCLQQLEHHPLAARIVAVFPTLVFGGRLDGGGPFPTSYLTAGLGEAARWLWLARWLRADASFHFIHAADIARVCVHLATQPHQANPEPAQGPLRRLVLGQPAVTVNETVRQLGRWRGTWIPAFGLDLRGWLVEGLIKLLRIEMTPWDRFSIRQRHFVHQPISPPERFGEVSHAPSLEAVFADAGLPQRGPLPPPPGRE
ncbi:MULTISPECIES: NAD(P)-dependent oxidoreductase [unclassified Cyanobium]|uniref:NAD-dependent epimerase/dehydratase family protein n=1 Tax=unclassified Cyanobium TaxID=2627006 RepID=UPI001648BC10|nr:NAD(P)-dependent oxidoreductase [Cyanobium sp. NS01]MBE9154964.1 NAD(P)-dependent oxidoreductase [Cyanobium sp. LEGE 06113]QNI70703.1 short chain dehydrogenase family protein [Cyanobium sp. NS01]